MYVCVYQRVLLLLLVVQSRELIHLTSSSLSSSFLVKAGFLFATSGLFFLLGTSCAVCFFSVCVCV